MSFPSEKQITGACGPYGRISDRKTWPARAEQTRAFQNMQCGVVTRCVSRWRVTMQVFMQVLQGRTEQVAEI